MRRHMPHEYGLDYAMSIFSWRNFVISLLLASILFEKNYRYVLLES